MGAPIAVQVGDGGGGGGVTNPVFKPRGIGENADAAPIGHAGDTSRPRRVNLSEGGSPESAPHRPRRQWGATGNQPPPILESAEATVALVEEHREWG